MSLAPSFKTVLIAALIGVGFAGVAEARNGQLVTAQLAQPVAQPTQVIANNTVWTCEADACRAIVRHETTVRSCRQLSREAGPVVSYAALTSEEITRCNNETMTARSASPTAVSQ